MDLRQSSGRPARAQQAPIRTAKPVQAVGQYQQAEMPRKLTKQWLLLAIALALAVASAVAWHHFTLPIGPGTDRYQVVFLDNDQVFFGKLKNTHGDYLRLEQAYSTRQSELPEDATEEQKAAVSGNVSLVKVGDLVYGPENIMMIRAEKVKFWQDLQPDSKVAKAIESAQ